MVTPGTGATTKQYLHDLIATDRRNPTVNAYGPLYGSPEYATDVMPILDPKTNTVDQLQGAGARSEHAGGARTRPRRARQAAAAVGLLGRGEDLGHQGQQPQLDVRQEGPRLAGGGDPRAGQPGVLQEGLRPSVGQAVPARADRPPAGDARSEDDEVHLRRHLLRHASSAVRLRRQRHAVDAAAAGRCGRLDQHQDVRRDRRRREVAGLDARSCSTPTATASATNAAEPSQPIDPTKDMRITGGPAPTP